MNDPSKADFKFCVPNAADSKGFDCVKSTNAPTPNPTPEPSTAPPSPLVIGDVCREEIDCFESDLGRIKGCKCDASRKCTGIDVESGFGLACNRFTNHCAPCRPGSLFCSCFSGNGCSDTGAVCDDGHCLPTADLELPCTKKGGNGCPCWSEKCGPQYACSAQTSRCILCPPGCKEKCAQASTGRNDTCAGLSTSCEECKANANCAWCGESGGCYPTKCPNGGAGALSCSLCVGVRECNGGGECIGPDMCKCNRGFANDAELGCKPENAVTTTTPSTTTTTTTPSRATPCSTLSSCGECLNSTTSSCVWCDTDNADTCAEACKSGTVIAESAKCNSTPTQGNAAATRTTTTTFFSMIAIQVSLIAIH